METHPQLFKSENGPQIELVKGKTSFDKYTMLTEKNIKFNEEMDNGNLLVGIQGVDKAGNESSINWVTYKLANYRPRTIITNIAMEIKDSGEKLLVINGRGYETEGVITKIIISKNKEEPYDYIIDAKDFEMINC